jgi:SNF2 family DNA or RNA helicase
MRNRFSGGWDFTGLLEDKKQEFKELLEGKVFKVSSKEVLSLPPLFHKRHYVDVIQNEDLLKEFYGGVGSIEKRRSAVAKAPATIEYIENMREQSSEPIVVFTDHIDSAVEIGVAFKVNPITGGMPAEVRMRVYDRFVAEGGVLVATIGAFSVGVNLVNCANLIFNDVSWVPGDNFQAMKRIHRIGQSRPCTIHYVLGGEVDEKILDKLQDKIRVIDISDSLALDASGG